MLRSSRSSGDTPIQFHADSLMDDAGCAQRVNPLELGILASPCKCRPDAARPHAGKPPLAYLLAKKRPGRQPVGW